MKPLSPKTVVAAAAEVVASFKSPRTELGKYLVGQTSERGLDALVALTVANLAARRPAPIVADPADVRAVLLEHAADLLLKGAR